MKVSDPEITGDMLTGITDLLEASRRPAVGGTRVQNIETGRPRIKRFIVMPGEEVFGE